MLIGRADHCNLVVTGPGCEVVSGIHARVVLQGDSWVIEDAGGRNGTSVDGVRVPTEGALPLEPGRTLSLGGPDLAFDVDIDYPEPAVSVTLVHAESGDPWEGSGPVLRIGRSEECEVCLLDELLVSRVHCEIFVGDRGDAFVRDAHSRNGTFLDGEVVSEEGRLEAGSRIRLGPEGPELLVEQVAVTGVIRPRKPAPAPMSTKKLPAPEPAVTAPDPEPALAAAGAVGSAPPAAPSGRTAFFKALIQETEQRNVSRTRSMVGAFVLLLVVTAGGVFAVSEWRVRETQAELASQRAELDRARLRADSTRAADLAEYRRLELELEAARTGSAPAAVVDSLRFALDDARSRTADLAAALERARDEMADQLSVGDSLRAAQELETERLRSVLASSQAGGISAAELAGLRAEVRAAEERAAQIEAGLRAIRGTDLASIAEANQEATGLVSVFVDDLIYDGSGFVISSSGYFVTNQHVANPQGRVPDSVHITMADQRTGHRARVASVAPPGGPDLAVLHIPNYVGPYIVDVDWDGTRARQGEPAALIGFPAGVATALDDTRTVRTSMSAGIFSKVTETQIQFDGFTIGGSSGSPIFNADGEVVAVHSSGLREAAGLGFAVPIPLVVPLLPADAQRELDLTSR